MGCTGGRRRCRRRGVVGRRDPAVDRERALPLCHGVDARDDSRADGEKRAATDGCQLSHAAPSPALSHFTEQLTVPARIDLRAGGTANLVMRNGSHVFHASLPATPTLGYTAAGDTSADA